MEESRREEQAGNPNQRLQTATIAPTPPERETPRVGGEELETVEASEDMDAPTERRKRVAPGSDADEELSIILTHIESYFMRQARRHDLEAISFSLRHLFSRVDFLYRQAMPDLDKWTVREETGRETFLRQQIWLHLQAVNRTLDRMAPLCHLLSDVIECLLETLDNEELWLRTFEEEDTLQLEQVRPSEQDSACGAQSRRPETRSAQSGIEPEVWERAVTIIMDRLLLWQEQHHKLTSFQQQFARSTLSPQDLSEIDDAFAIILDSAGAIFGDILPNFRLVGLEDREEISALLFDLMQQSDQMLVQFEVTLKPLTSLLRHFAAVSESG